MVTHATIAGVRHAWIEFLHIIPSLVGHLIWECGESLFDLRIGEKFPGLVVREIRRQNFAFAVEIVGGGCEYLAGLLMPLADCFGYGGFPVFFGQRRGCVTVMRDLLSYLL
jgi:hypothetical protein